MPVPAFSYTPLPPERVEKNRQRCKKEFKGYPICEEMQKSPQQGGDGYYFRSQQAAIDSLAASAKDGPCNDAGYTNVDINNRTMGSGPCRGKPNSHFEIYCFDESCPPKGCRIGSVFGCKCCSIFTGKIGDERWKKNTHE